MDLLIKWKWLLWAATSVLLFFNIRTPIQQNPVSANETDVNLYDPKYHPNQSIIDYLIFRSLISGKAHMTVTGSSVTRGSGSSHPSKTWRSLIEKNLQNSHPALRQLTVSNHGYSGYTSVDLLQGDVTTPIIEEQPDVLFIETSVINNHNKNVTLADTFSSLDQLHQLYTKALPETRIVLLSPNPCTENKFGPILNQLKLKYTDYITETETYIRNQGWTYFDTHGAMLTYMSSKKVLLPSILKDGIHPNDQGYKIWAVVLWPFMKQKLEQL